MAFLDSGYFAVVQHDRFPQCSNFMPHCEK